MIYLIPFPLKTPSSELGVIHTPALILHFFSLQVRFRLKNQPWFVSDTTRQDFDWSLNALLENSLPSLSQLGTNMVLILDGNSEYVTHA